MIMNSESSRDYLKGSVAARWVLCGLRWLTALWQARVDMLAQRGWVAGSLRALYERPLRTCGQTLVIAVLTNVGWLIWQTRALDLPAALLRIGLVVYGVAACTSTSDWPTLTGSSLVLQWLSRRRVQRQ